MRVVRKKQQEVLAILVADIHLSMRPPIARSEDDWFKAMAKPLLQLGMLASHHRAKILCAGDVFDKWSAPPELINWALEHLPHMYAIPGNHDLPHHRPELMHRSAFGTLVKAGKISLIDENPRHLGGGKLDGKGINGGLWVAGRMLNEDVPDASRCRGLRVLLTHEFIWVPGAGHLGAPKDRRLQHLASGFEGYNVVVVGDNHQGFLRKCGDCLVYNCGGFMRRRSNEGAYRPRVGLLHPSGDVSMHYLDLEGEQLDESVTPRDEEEEEEISKELDEIIGGLADLEADEFSFRDAITKAIQAKKVDKAVKQALLEAMGS